MFNIIYYLKSLYNFDEKDLYNICILTHFLKCMSDTGNNLFITLIKKKKEMKLKIHFGYHQKNINSNNIFFLNNNRNYILNNLIKKGRKVVFFSKNRKRNEFGGYIEILKYCVFPLLVWTILNSLFTKFHKLTSNFSQKKKKKKTKSRGLIKYFILCWI